MELQWAQTQKRERERLLAMPRQCSSSAPPSSVFEGFVIRSSPAQGKASKMGAKCLAFFLRLPILAS